MYREQVRDLRHDLVQEIYDQHVFDIDDPCLKKVMEIIHDVFGEYLK